MTRLSDGLASPADPDALRRQLVGFLAGAFNHPADTGPSGAFPLSDAADEHKETDGAMAAALVGIDCQGSVYNAPKPSL